MRFIKISPLCLAIICIFLILKPTSIYSLTGGGTINNPYILTTTEDLKTLSSGTSGKYYKLGANIEWDLYKIIGDTFSGFLDGDGYCIYFPDESETHKNYQRYLFRVNSGTIQNLNITYESNLSMTSEYGARVTLGLCHTNDGNIINVVRVGSASNYMTNFNYNIGMTYYNNGLIDDCLVITNAQVNSSPVGGIAHQNGTNGIIRNTAFYGSVYGGYGSNVGGIAGVNSGIIEDCYFSGTYAGGSSTRLGGLTSTNAGTIRNSYAILQGNYHSTQQVSNSNTYGDAASNTGTISNCYAMTTTTDSLKVAASGNTRILNSTQLASTEIYNELMANSSYKKWIRGVGNYPYPVFRILGMSLDISVGNLKYGDNTKIPIYLSCPKAGKIYIYNHTLGIKIGEVYGSSTFYYEPDTEGTFSIYAQIVDSNDRVMFTSNFINVEKVNVLTKLVSLLSTSDNRVVIINDSDRVIDDNAKNRLMIQQIKGNTCPIYVIGHNLAPILYGLFIT